jgi:hypothetical protein
MQVTSYRCTSVTGVEVQSLEGPFKCLKTSSMSTSEYDNGVSAKLNEGFL